MNPSAFTPSSAPALDSPGAYTAPPPPPHVLPFRFTGTSGEYFRIWIVNTVLSILTLGIYSAWAKVRRMQYFYRHTWLEGSSFEYLANPYQVLKGRLVIGAIFAGLFASQYYSLGLYLTLIGLLFVATPWLAVKALAFNAKSSAYRNVRFAFAGRANEAYGEYLPVFLLYLVTCGMAYPYAQWRLTRFAVRRHYFGDRAFDWVARASDYFVVYLLGMLMVLPVYAGFVAIGVVMAVNQKAAPAAPPDPVLFGVAGAVAYAYLLLPGAFVRARLSNLLYGGLRLDHHRFAANQRPLELFKLYATNALAIVLSLGLAIPWAQIRLARYRAEHLWLYPGGPLEASALELGGGNAAGDAASDFGEVDLDLGL